MMRRRTLASSFFPAKAGVQLGEPQRSIEKLSQLGPASG